MLIVESKLSNRFGHYATTPLIPSFSSRRSGSTRDERYMCGQVVCIYSYICRARRWYGASCRRIDVAVDASIAHYCNKSNRRVHSLHTATRHTSSTSEALHREFIACMSTVFTRTRRRVIDASDSDSSGSDLMG